MTQYRSLFDMKKNRPLALFFTCEHASNAVPADFQKLFLNKKKILSSHRGLDIGAAALARHLATEFNAPLIEGKYSRLLIDLNRSLDSETLFSEFTEGLSELEKQKLIRDYHLPHWSKSQKMISQAIKKGFRVLHFGIHSFTPKLKGEIRNCEIGLLYDPHRKRELAFCDRWKRTFNKISSLRIRKNYPYKGTGDGLVVQLRKDFSAKDYVGIELEVNQKCLVGMSRKKMMSSVLADSLSHILSQNLD